MSQSPILYRTDSTDTIVSVSDNWCAFAEQNAWQGPSSAGDIVGRKLWDFIQGPETGHLYQELCRRVRAGKRCRPLPFRCDSPAEKRFLELDLQALPAGQIEFTSRLLRTEPRRSLSLLEPATPRSSDFLKLCSVCKKVEHPPGHWAELEVALASLRLFEGDAMPQLTHGLCPRCYETAAAEVEDF